MGGKEGARRHRVPCICYRRVMPGGVTLQTYRARRGVTKWGPHIATFNDDRGQRYPVAPCDAVRQWQPVTPVVLASLKRPRFANNFATGLVIKYQLKIVKFQDIKYAGKEGVGL